MKLFCEVVQQTVDLVCRILPFVIPPKKELRGCKIVNSKKDINERIFSSHFKIQLLNFLLKNRPAALHL